MNRGVKLLSVVAAACVLTGAIFVAEFGKGPQDGDASFFAGDKTTIRLWYDDDNLTPYLLAQAVNYNDTHKNTRLEPTLVSALEYLENISSASVDAENYPDLYILSNDSLEKAYLAGLASPVTDTDIMTADRYPQAALSSVSYKGQYIAYPYYFETSTLLYNRTYLENAARDILENAVYMEDAVTGEEDASIAGSSEDAAVAAASVELTDAEVETKVNEMLPNSIADIITFAETYNAPEDVEAVFKWDVSDIFYNYFFLGNYLNLGGNAGDDPSQIDIYNENTINCMSLYQQMGQFFAIESGDSDYDSIMQDFIDGRIVFTLATTDSLSLIRQAREEGTCSFEFGVRSLPDLTDTYKTRTMSVTRCIAVNGYSEHEAEANEVAGYLCMMTNDDMYNMTGKIAACKTVPHEDDKIQEFLKAYETSVPMPKMIATSNFWMQLEISFEQIWDGADPNETLRKVSEEVKTQVSGREETVTEPRIETTQQISLTGAEEDEDYDEGMSD